MYELSKRTDGDKLKIQPIRLQTYEHWLVFSKNTPIEIIEGLTNTVMELKKTKEWDEIINRYLN